MTNRSDHYFIYPKNYKGQKTGTTICVILRDGLIFHGEATLSPRDQFCRKTGRLLAFERAQQQYQRYLFRMNQKNDDGN